jgi:hypothetical protein
MARRNRSGVNVVPTRKQTDGVSADYCSGNKSVKSKSGVFSNPAASRRV